MLNFDFIFRPIRTIYILILTILVFYLSDSYLAAAVTALAIIDVDIDAIKELVRMTNDNN